MTKRQKQALETRQALLDKGLELFAIKGFDNVTVEEITHTCDVSKGAFYAHFESKYDIFNERFKDIDAYYIEAKNNIPNHLPASEKIILFYKMQMLFIRDELGKDLIRTVYMNAMSLTIGKNHYLADPERNLYQVVYAYVKEGVESREFKSNFPLNETVSLITRCMRGTIYDWVIFGEEYDLVKEMDKFIVAILDGLKR